MFNVNRYSNHLDHGLKGFFAILLLIAGCLFLSCGHLTELTGTSSGVETRFTSGMVFNEDGTPASNTLVKLIPVKYNPYSDGPIPDALLDTTGANGRYSIRHPRGEGYYNIEACHLSRRTRALINGIFVTTADTISVSAEILRKPASVKVLLPDTLEQEAAYVYLPGTTHFSRIRNGCAAFDSVPAGLIPAVYYVNTRDTAKNHVVTTSMQVAAGGSLSITDYSQWKYSRKIYLNTTAAGANVAEDVTGFPVLVRLGQTDFDFSKAAGNGADIRFMSTDRNVPLTHDIETWDSAASIGVIWVLVDTVFGNNDAQSITMYWGANAASSSNGGSVFDTARGFAGVWHLNDNPAYGAGGAIKDRTANQYHGTSSARMSASSGIDGVAGRGLSFDGINHLIVVPRPVQEDFTVAFWMKADSNSEINALEPNWFSGNGLVDGDVTQVHDDFGITYLNNGIAFGTGNPDTSIHSGRTVNDNAWHFIVATRERSSGSLLLYVDGVLAAAGRGGTQPLTAPAFLCFGAQLKNLYYLRGVLDEIAISHTVRSAAWIRLSYMNQKKDNQFITQK